MMLLDDLLGLSSVVTICGLAIIVKGSLTQASLYQQCPEEIQDGKCHSNQHISQCQFEIHESYQGSV